MDDKVKLYKKIGGTDSWVYTNEVDDTISHNGYSITHTAIGSEGDMLGIEYVFATTNVLAGQAESSKSSSVRVYLMTATQAKPSVTTSSALNNPTPTIEIKIPWPTFNAYTDHSAGRPSGSSVGGVTLKVYKPDTSLFQTYTSFNSPNVIGNYLVYSKTLSSALAGDGLYTMKAFWKDTKNVVSGTGELQFNYDGTAETPPSITAPVNDYVYIGTSITISGAAIDSDNYLMTEPNSFSLAATNTANQTLNIYSSDPGTVTATVSWITISAGTQDYTAEDATTPDTTITFNLSENSSGASRVGYLKVDSDDSNIDDLLIKVTQAGASSGS